MTTVGEIMSRELVTVAPTSTVAEAATIMGEHQVGSALVVDGDRPVGIFTERDALRALASDADAPRHPVSQWMSRDPITIPADTQVREARRLMLERGFRHLPVVDGDRVVGIVSLRDLSRAEP
jgi:CBS domain-containing protein